jgi:hypothetical protein
MLTLKGRAVRDPRFLKVMGRLQQSAQRTRHHPPPSEKAAQAQAAAVGPANEKIAGAKANQAGAMQQAQTGKPDNNSFLALLRAEIQKVIPKQVEGTKNFLKGNDRQQLKGAMTGNIAQQKQAATGDLKAAATAPLNPEAVPGKPVTPLPSEPAPAAPPSVGAADALPAPKTDADVSLQGGQQEADRALTDNQLTTPQLAEANDPRFSRVITAKSQVDGATPALPAKYRLDEQRITTGAAAKAVADEKKGLSAFQAQKGKTVGEVRQRQLTAKEKDELERKRVTDTIERIFNRTKAAVDAKLASLDEEAAQLFDRGTDAALARMRDYIESRFDDRYTGIRGKARWVRDKFLDLPDSVKQWFVEARQVFLQDLDRLVVLVAALVERRLQQAKDIISRGQQEIADYVNGLPANLQNVGRAAEKEMAGRFDDLRAAVEDKKGELAGKLAMRYKEAMDKGDAALKEIRDAHKSLVQRVKEFVGEVVEVLRNFKNRIVSMLRKAASVIGLIVSSPIRFLKNLLSAIKQGIAQFRDRIWEHLKRAFLEWLFGNLKDSGVTMPKDFSLPSILMLVLQVLGLTYDRLRAKAVRLLGERNVALVERVGELLRGLWNGGPVALWESMKEHLSDLKARVVDELQSWVIASIIKAALMKLAMMFNPVGAIIQAILAIYKVVTFLIERINQILEFVSSIFESVVEIATGAIGAAANCIERALAKALVLLIAFLAHFLGLSGVADRVRSIIKKLQGAVDRAVDKVIEKVVGGVGRLLGRGTDRPPVQEPKTAHDARWEAAVTGVNAELGPMKKRGLALDDLEKALPHWRKTYGFSALRVEAKDGAWEIIGAMSASKRVASAAEPGSRAKPFKLWWPKPRTSEYPPIALGGPIGTRRTQDYFEDHIGKEDSRGIKIRWYYPEQPTRLPDEDGKPTGPEIGLASRWHITLQKLVGPLSQDTTPGGEKLNRILRRYGFRPKKEDMQGDHAHEIQLGGKDEVQNLWPLETSRNASAGASLAQAVIEYPDSGRQAKLSSLKTNKREYWFKITKFTA